MIRIGNDELEKAGYSYHEHKAFFCKRLKLAPKRFYLMRGEAQHVDWIRPKRNLTRSIDQGALLLINRVTIYING